jgi:hypothetical protein
MAVLATMTRERERAREALAALLSRWRTRRYSECRAVGAPTAVRVRPRAGGRARRREADAASSLEEKLCALGCWRAFNLRVGLGQTARLVVDEEVVLVDEVRD